jgi:hypothetical protein
VRAERAQAQGTPRHLLPLSRSAPRAGGRRPPFPLLQSRRGTTNPALFLAPVRLPAPARLLASVDPAKRVVLLRSTGLAGSLLILLVVLFPGGRPAAFISSRLAPSSEPALCAADPAGFPFFNSRDTRFSNFLSVFVQTRGFLSPLRVFIFGIQDLLHSFSWKPEDNSQKKRFFFLHFESASLQYIRASASLDPAIDSNLQ